MPTDSSGTIAWLAAMLTLVLALSSSLAVYAHNLFWAHMIVHLLMIMVVPHVRPDVPTQAIIPIDKIATRRGQAFAPKVNPNPGSYRGITPKMRKEAQRIGERWQGPGEYDVGHRTPLSQVPPRQRVRLRSEEFSGNRADGNAIAKTNELRRRAGLYTR